MRRPLTSVTLRLLAVLALLLAAAALPAAADETGEETGEAPDCYQTAVDEEGNPSGPEFCTTEVWFHQAETKAGNLGATGLTGFPTWDTEAPTRSVQEGAGGGYFTNGTTRQMEGTSDPEFGGQFEGSFTGPIDNLAVTMYLWAPALQAQGTQEILSSLDLHVDGVLLARGDSLALPLAEGGDSVMVTEFVITGLSSVMERRGLDLSADAEHEITLFLTSYAIATTTAVYVYDTTEVPSGMVFNLPDVGDRFTVKAF